MLLMVLRLTVFAGQAAIEQPSHPYSHNSGRVSRFASKASLMLPTITEDEAVEVCDMSGSPSWSSCISWSSGCQPYISCSRDYPVAYEGVVDWQSETEPDAEELLLAAIDERLQQLIAMRDQRHAAAALRAQRPVAPPAQAAPAVHGLAPAPADQLLASGPAQELCLHVAVFQHQHGLPCSSRSVLSRC
jgi:hypothetical protein